jgi:hypothetical protein
LAITYTPATNFNAKDSLPTNDPDKVIKGSEFTTEFTAIQTAFGLAAPAASPTFTGTVTIASVDINGGTIDGVTIGGSSAGAITGTTITGTSFVSSGDMTFGDNDKAIFGAGSDLQIYHSGSNSIIDDLGTGNLLIRSDGAAISLQVNSKNSVRAVADEDVELYYNGNQKLATTSTGIDVTGTVTADGLTVSNNSATLTLSNPDTSASVGQTLGNIIFEGNDASSNADGTRAEIEAEYRGAGGATELKFKTASENSTDLRERLKIGFNGDISFYEDTGTTPKFFWDASAESLGIGTTSLATALSPANPGIHIQSSSGPYAVIQTTAEGSLLYKVDEGNTGASSIHRFDVDGDEAMRIDSSGNVGIGEDDPGGSVSFNGTVKLQTKDGTDTGYTASGASAGRLPEGLQIATYNNFNSSTSLSGIGFLNNGPGGASMGSYIGGLSASTGWGGTIVFGQTSGSASYQERMRIDSSGNVGIGTSSPDYKLHIEAAGDNLKLSRSGAGEFAMGITNGPSLVFEDKTAAAERMRIDSSGNLLVGTTTSFGGLINAPVTTTDEAIVTQSNSTSSSIHLNFRNPNGFVGSISTSSSATAYNTSSDYRLKDVDGPITNSGAYIDALKPVQGSWKADGSRFIGLIAHEVQEVSETQIATGEKDGEEMQAMDYSAPELIANLIAEIQSLRARVAQLEGV